MEEETAINTTKMQGFIAESKTRLNEILKRLHWDIEKTLKQVEPTEKERYKILPRDKEPELPPSCATRNSIVIDLEELRKIVADADKEIPNYFSDLQLNFARDQKLAIYEHVVANTAKLTEPETNVLALGDNTLTFAQIVAQKKRESKKRRRHRRSKPTHTEEVRAVVDLHMQALQQYLNIKTDKHDQETIICKRENVGADCKHLDGKTYTTGSSAHAKVYSNYMRRSKSYERKSFKIRRHRSRSKSPSYKHKDHKDRIHDRSRSNEIKQQKYRGSSCLRNVSNRYSRNPRSRSPKRNHSNRLSRSRKRDGGEQDRSPHQTHRLRSKSPKHSYSRRSRSPNHNRYRRSRSSSPNRNNNKIHNFKTKSRYHDNARS